MIWVQRGESSTRLWMGPYGWMRFHRETLSASRCFKPLSHDRDLRCHWEWRKSPQCLSHCGCCCCLPLTDNLSLTVMLRNQPQLPTDPAASLYRPSFNISVPPSIHPFLHAPPSGFQMFVSSLSPSTSLHPPPLWSPQKRLIQEGWAGVSELLLLCPMRCFHSTFLLLCCFYGPDMLTVQVAQSDVIQLHQPHKGCLFSSLKGHVRYLELRCHSCSVFLLTTAQTRGTSSSLAGAGRTFWKVYFAEFAQILFMFLT